MEGWDDLIAARNMGQTIQAWEFPDGHFYVLPIYSNAILWAWRSDILAEIGVNEPPRTYEDVLAVGQQLKQQSPDRFIWARQPLTQDTWYERWFDFFILYYAASNGQPLIEGDQITADDSAAVATLTFLQDLAQNNLLLTQQVTDPFENGVAVSSQLGPWTFSAWAERFPNLRLNETYVLTPPPAPQAGDEVKTFADAKGLVMYAQSSPEQKEAMWHFITWVFSDPQHDLSWLQRTNLPPARDDLATNEAFQAYFGEHPELLAYAEQLPNGVPPISNPNFTDIQVALGQQAVIPVVLGQKEPQQAWDDFKNAVQPMLQ
jgi:multiple sugar transport system substrate-binding protein